MNIIKRRNRGVSTVFGSILFMVLALTLASTLFIALYEYNQITQEAIILEEIRTQEKIALVQLTRVNVSGITYVRAIDVNNTGSVAVRIRALYIDGEFKCDPSNPTINQDDTYINAKESRQIRFPEDIIYNPLSKIVVATERGTKSTEYMWKLTDDQSSSETEKIYIGPLRLDFEKFYYAKCDKNGNYIPPWNPGWSVEKNAGYIAWNITVTNIDNKVVILTKYSAFTLVPNAEGAQRPWYIKLPSGQGIRIEPKQTINLIYVWDAPEGKNAQQVPGADRYRVFLTFTGFWESKTYGQTIPFEAVLVN